MDEKYVSVEAERTFSRTGIWIDSNSSTRVEATKLHDASVQS